MLFIRLSKYMFFVEKGLFSFEAKSWDSYTLKRRNGDSSRIRRNLPYPLGIIVSQEIYPPTFTTIERGVLK
jgi:hypothetical protein